MSLINKNSVEKTTNLSIYIQTISLIASAIGISYKLPKEHEIINKLLIMETTVQLIEYSFYIVVLQNMAKTVTNMAKTRYYDWIITTPAMHLTTIIYFDYLYRIENKLDMITFTEFIKQNIKNIKIIFWANFFMLLSGYLYEIGKINKKQATIFGYIFFIIVFGTIYNEYAKKTEFSKKLFYGIFIIWSGYGVGFIFDDTAKNNIFNILDLFAKNFFGIYLFFVASKLAI
jgi:hypothetical protein